jgi:hypothetical protein
MQSCWLLWYIKTMKMQLRRCVGTGAGVGAGAEPQTESLPKTHLQLRRCQWLQYESKLSSNNNTEGTVKLMRGVVRSFPSF